MRLRFLATAIILTLGCGSEPPKLPKLSETMPNIPIPPEAEVVSKSGGEDVLQIRFKTTLDPESTADYYRTFFSRNPWRLVSDTKTADGAIAMYAEGSGPPMWVTIRKAVGTSGSTVDLAGAKLGEKKP